MGDIPLIFLSIYSKTFQKDYMQDLNKITNPRITPKVYKLYGDCITHYIRHLLMTFEFCYIIIVLADDAHNLIFHKQIEVNIAIFHMYPSLSTCGFFRYA